MQDVHALFDWFNAAQAVHIRYEACGAANAGQYQLTVSLFTKRPKIILEMNCTTPSAESSDCAANAKLAKLQAGQAG